VKGIIPSLLAGGGGNPRIPHRCGESMLNTAQRLEYTARQSARVAWYMGHYLATQRFREADPNARVKGGVGLERILEEMGALFLRDLDNVAKGYYPLPRDRDERPLKTSRAFLADLPVSAERKARGDGAEVFSPENADSYPTYFLQNFHYQTGGYLTAESAKLYDMQVEVLFSGTGNAMRRQCLVPIARALHGRDQRGAALLDVACGTGRFTRFAAEAFPRLQVSGCDLSAAYVAEAERHVRPYRALFKTAAAEGLPFPDASFDFVTCIYLYHEIPPEVRRAVAGEFARVLKHGGLLVFMDSLQRGDRPALDSVLESFPAHFHEPYYPSYLRENLGAIFCTAGLKTVSEEPVFLSKMIVAQKKA
jgi:ubiquinone/menaquinone biosynthesis C-methylase UbiE